MKTVAKVAIGCGVALVLAGTAAVALLVGGAWWFKDKLQQATAHEGRIEALKKKANAAAPFSRPADDVIQEPRLLKFLEIRKRMSPIYEQHRPEIEKLNRKEKGDLRDAWNAFGWINELRRAHAEAQADVGMGDEEYRFIVEQVYKSAWASTAASPEPIVVPKANVELFKKHEADVKKYAMNGLEMLGL
jgi:hypothetical protein